MTRELIGGYPPADGREQIGRFLRFAFPLDLGSFPKWLSDLQGKARMKLAARH